MRPALPTSRINYLNGIRQAVQHLAALRHIRIAFVAGPRQLKSALARTAAFKECIAEIGLSSEMVVEGDHTMEGGMRALVQLVGAPNPPTAVQDSLKPLYEKSIPEYNQKQRAGVVQWQYRSFPSFGRGFDSHRPLHNSQRFNRAVGRLRVSSR